MMKNKEKKSRADDFSCANGNEWLEKSIARPLQANKKNHFQDMFLFFFYGKMTGKILDEKESKFTKKDATKLTFEKQENYWTNTTHKFRE